MTEEPETSADWRWRFAAYLGLCSFGLAVGAFLAFPVVRLAFFGGPLGALREAVAPVSGTLTIAPTWARGLWTAVALVSMLSRPPVARGLQAGACGAALGWFGSPFVVYGSAMSVAGTSIALQGIFGALWAAALWPHVPPKHRIGASMVGIAGMLLSVAHAVFNTRMRLGA